MSLRDDLIAARALIDTPEKWRKDDDVFSSKCCAILAVNRSATGRNTYSSAAVPLYRALWGQLPNEHRGIGGEAYLVGRFNDHPDTTHADIMALFDRAIAATGSAS